MKTSLEFEGKSIDKALDNASAELNMPREQLRYDILSHGSSGIFGLTGTKNAKIKVHLTHVDTASPLTTDLSDKNREEFFENINTAATVPSVYNSNTRFLNRHGFGFSDKPTDLGRKVLEQIIDLLSGDANITVDENSDQIMYTVRGGNVALLIGKRGKTLDAIQSLVEKIVNKHANGENRIRVHVDIEGYMKKRQEKIEMLATRLAEKSRRIRKPISLGQMSAHERRIIHMTLKDDPNVKTKSRGEGYSRKLVIYPQKSRPRRLAQ